MADIRIKDLTTLESASLTGDVFVIDGTTGTRKLSAFSPTFGGNATVTGTLTVNGGLTASGGLSCTTADVTAGYIILRGYGSQDGGLIFLGQSSNNNFINSSATVISTAIAGTTTTRVQAEGLRVLTTTASTSTSTGALVVGNGTSGGLGVGGAIYAGGNIVNTSGSDFASVSSSLASIHTVYGAPRITLIRSASSLNNKYFDIVNNSDGQVSFRFVDDNLASATTALSLTKTNATVAAGLTVTTNLAVNGTTASTSTSSGALVVSGGVGVAGAVNAGTFYGLVDGVTAPATESGYARIYVDSADGDLKVKFGDGTVKTIATDS